MSPADIRLLIYVAYLSNGQAAAALDVDDRLIRRWKAGTEEPVPEKADGLIAIAADALAAQLIRAVEIAADGKIEIARLTVNPRTIAVEGIERFSQATQIALRAALIVRLTHRGLKIERDDQ